MARLQFLMEQGRRVGLLLGDSGIGKSLVLEVFADQLRRRGTPVAKANLVGVQPVEWLWLVAAGFGLGPNPHEPLVALWHMLGDRLAEYRYQQLGAAVLLDDADQADPAVLVQVVRLVQLGLTAQAHLTVVLAGQPDGLGHLPGALLELTDLRIDLAPWGPEDTEQFIGTCLKRAGRNEPAFSQTAILRLHELAAGIPRRVAQLADLALAAGAGCQLDLVDDQTIDAVYEELGTVRV